MKRQGLFKVKCRYAIDAIAADYRNTAGCDLPSRDISSGALRDGTYER